MALIRNISNAQFQALLKPDRYQVFLMASAIPIPFNLAVHCWLLIQQGGIVNRWEFGKFRSSPHPGGIGVLHNFFKPLGGMNRYLGLAQPRHGSHCYGVEEGSAHSHVAAMIAFIESESGNYPFRRSYRYLGPNSNTYVQWILNHFEESTLRLPWRAIGKNYPAPLLRKPGQ